MEIEASEYLTQTCATPQILVDVRSEKEYLKGHLEGAINIPILNNQHRHQVGLCYKEEGQDEAIKLGHQLVDPIKPELLERWKSQVQGHEHFFVHCWRGGLRSNISKQWMKEIGLQPIVITGGYRAVRHALLKEFERPRNFVVLTGLTGSGKTAFLKTLPKNWFIDLEKLANHRGSVFGSMPGETPAQQSFENSLGLELTRQSGQEFILEDESRLIGSMKIPDPFFKQMQERSLIYLTAPVEERVETIYREYIEENEQGPQELEKTMRQSLKHIQRRLGGKAFKEVDLLMEKAFSSMEKEDHQKWIHDLVTLYYDPYYLKHLNKIKDRILFQGNKQELHEFINYRFGRSRTR